MSEFFITLEDWKTLIGYAKVAYDKTKCEIAGMLAMQQDEDGNYVIHTPTILKQTISSGLCTLDKDALTAHYSDYGRKYPGTRHVWWHSHHTMAAFWSGTDIKTIEESTSADFTVSLVINLKEEYKLRVQYFNPILASEDVTLNIIGAPNIVTDDMVKSFESLCSKTTPAYGVTYKNGKKQNVPEPQQALLPMSTELAFSVSQIVNAVDNMLSRYATGEYTYAHWRAKVRELNLLIKDDGYKVKELKKQKLEAEVMHCQAIDLVLYDGEPIDFNFPGLVESYDYGGYNYNHYTTETIPF